MALQHTLDLVNRYGESLKNGTISDDMLDDLLDQGTFKRSPGTDYVNPHAPTTDKSHTQMDAIKDFVQVIGEELTPDVLHTLTARIIARAPERGENTFMRNSTLEKALLAYEMAKDPESAASHFDSPRIKIAFAGKNDIGNLKRVILNPLVEFFHLSIKYQTALQELKTLLEKEPFDDQIKQKTQQVIAHIETLNRQGKESIIDLTKTLNNTHSLLKGDLSVKDYQAKAQIVEGKPSVGMKVLGGLMIALGLVVAAIGITIAATGIGVVAGAGIAATGAGVLVAGVGIFSKGMPSGLSKAINDLSNARDKPRNEGNETLPPCSPSQ